VRSALLSIPRKSAGAGSGWLNETIRDLAFADGDAGEEALGLIRLLLQDIAQGLMPDRAAHALGAAVLCALDKGTPGDVRPIAIPECLRRAAARAVAVQYSAPWARHLAPLQYGVATRNGLEQVQLQVRGLLQRHPDWCVLRADCRNAFNTLSRRPIMQELRAHFPELLPMVGQFYLRDGTLHFCGADGDRVRLRSVTGVQQGDPLGPVLFALGIHPALQAVQRRHPQVHILAYLDDVHLVGPQGAVHEAFQTLRAQFAAIGLTTRQDKNLVWTPSQTYLPVWYWPNAFATIARSGYDVLGVPYCAEEELPARVLARCMDEAAKGRPNFAQKLAALRRLPESEPKRGPHAALLLLRTCALPTVGHLLRCLPPGATAPMAAAVDQAVRSLVAELAAGPEGPADLPEDSWGASALTLPIGQGGGGHGLPSQAAVAPLAHAAALLAAAPAVVERCQLAQTVCSRELADAISRMYAEAAAAVAPAAAAGAEGQATPPGSPAATAASSPLLPFQQTFVDLSTSISTQLSLARETNPFAAEVGAGPQHGLQHEFTQAWQRQQQQLLDAHIAAGGSRRDVIWAQDARGYGAGAWMLQTPQAGAPRRMPGGSTFWEGLRACDFRISLRRSLRMRFPALAALPGGCCPLCGGQCDAYGDHVDSCAGLAGLFDPAHNMVRDAIFIIAEEARMRPALEVRGLVPGTRERPADVLLPAHVDHGLQQAQRAAAAAAAGATPAAAAPAAGTVGRAACIDVTRAGVYCAPRATMGPQGALREAARRKAARAPPEGHIIVPLAFTTGGSFQGEVLGRALGRWAAQRLADADAGGNAREYIINAQRIRERAAVAAMPLCCGSAGDGAAAGAAAPGSAGAGCAPAERLGGDGV